MIACIDAGLCVTWGTYAPRGITERLELVEGSHKYNRPMAPSRRVTTALGLRQSCFDCFLATRISGALCPRAIPEIAGEASSRVVTIDKLHVEMCKRAALCRRGRRTHVLALYDHLLTTSSSGPASGSDLSLQDLPPSQHDRLQQQSVISNTTGHRCCYKAPLHLEGNSLSTNFTVASGFSCKNSLTATSTSF